MRWGSDTYGSEEPSGPGPSVVVIRSRGVTHSVQYHPGETLLETARRARLPLGSNCERGDCGACAVTIVSGRVWMRANSVLSAQDIASGIVLGCQSMPIGDELEIELF
jgi:3-ketosteroid 9alpha-monooxygenase subunit B